MKSGVQLNLSARESQRILIDTAAEILHKSRTTSFWKWSVKLLKMLFSTDESLILMAGNMRSSSKCLMLRLQMILPSKNCW